VKNPFCLGLKVDGTTHKALKSLEDIHNQVTDMGLVNALHDLYIAYLVSGTPIMSMPLAFVTSGRWRTTWA
jgi:hypothetical protein